MRCRCDLTVTGRGGSDAYGGTQVGMAMSVARAGSDSSFTQAPVSNPEARLDAATDVLAAVIDGGRSLLGSEQQARGS